LSMHTATAVPLILHTIYASVNLCETTTCAVHLMSEDIQAILSRANSLAAP
jgi:hypothetical protein